MDIVFDESIAIEVKKEEIDPKFLKIELIKYD